MIVEDARMADHQKAPDPGKTSTPQEPSRLNPWIDQDEAIPAGACPYGISTLLVEVAINPGRLRLTVRPEPALVLPVAAPEGPEGQGPNWQQHHHHNDPDQAVMAAWEIGLRRSHQTSELAHPEQSQSYNHSQ